MPVELNRPNRFSIKHMSMGACAHMCMCMHTQHCVVTNFRYYTEIEKSIKGGRGDSSHNITGDIPKGQ